MFDCEARVTACTIGREAGEIPDVVNCGAIPGSKGGDGQRDKSEAGLDAGVTTFLPLQFARLDEWAARLIDGLLQEVLAEWGCDSDIESS